nr:AsnC family transcriptional regulator [uncultured Brevundimonas sp.]
MSLLDPVDQRILQRLRADGRISNADLATAVGLSPSACLRRVRRLRGTGRDPGLRRRLGQ